MGDKGDVHQFYVARAVFGKGLLLRVGGRAEAGH